MNCTAHRHERLTQPQPALLADLCEHLKLPLLARDVVLKGLHRSHGLSVVMPLVFELLNDSKTIQIEQRQPPSYSMMGGIMSCAVDLFTRPGKVLDTAAFHVEGGVTDRRLLFDRMVELEGATENEEMHAVGIHEPATYCELKVLIRDNLDDLNRIRRRIISKIITPLRKYDLHRESSGIPDVLAVEETLDHIGLPLATAQV